MAPPSDISGCNGGIAANGYGGEANVYAAQIANLITVPMAMQAAVELDLFEIIAMAQGSGRGISAAEIADQLPVVNKVEATGKLDRLLRLLAAYSVVSCSVDGGGLRVFGLTPAGKYFVRDEDGVSLVPYMSLALEPVCLASWGKLKDAILEGGNSFVKAHGMHAFDYVNKDPKFNQTFNLAMVSHTTVMIKKLLEHYKGFENLKEVVDVGGGFGNTLKIILSKYPSVKGINFDLPEVTKHAVSFPGIKHVGGDMFESIPFTSGAILMKWILMCWDDNECLKILKNCNQALTSNGKVIIMEEVLGDEDDESTKTTGDVFQLDTLLLTQMPLGKVRTKKEFVALANASGFSNVEFECSACSLSVIEFWK